MNKANRVLSLCLHEMWLGNHGNLVDKQENATQYDSEEEAKAAAERHKGYGQSYTIQKVANTHSKEMPGMTSSAHLFIVKFSEHMNKVNYLLDLIETQTSEIKQLEKQLQDLRHATWGDKSIGKRFTQDMSQYHQYQDIKAKLKAAHEKELQKHEQERSKIQTSNMEKNRKEGNPSYYISSPDDKKALIKHTNARNYHHDKLADLYND